MFNIEQDVLILFARRQVTVKVPKDAERIILALAEENENIGTFKNKKVCLDQDKKWRNGFFLSDVCTEAEVQRN